jgi:hypothetical protein
MFLSLVAPILKHINCDGVIEDGVKKNESSSSRSHSRSFLVPGAGIEPAQHCYHWCLRPARLPIPPSGLIGLRKYEFFFNKKDFGFRIVDFRFLISDFS